MGGMPYFGGCSSLLSQPVLVSVFREDRGRRNQSTATCAVPCHREVAPKPDVPRSWDKSAVLLGPWNNSAAGFKPRQIKLGHCDNLLIIVVVIVLLVGGGWYGRGRWF
jgi:hypothetical protein